MIVTVPSQLRRSDQLFPAMTATFVRLAVAIAIGWFFTPVRAQETETEFRARLDVLERERAAYHGSPAIRDTKTIQAALRPDDIVVVFFLAEPQSFRWVLSNEHIVFDRIASRGIIEKEVAGLAHQLRAPSGGGDITAAATRLGGVLFDGISTADDRPMVIVPHGALHDVPFEVLTLQNRLVIERHAVSYAPSLNALVHPRRSPATTAPVRVLWHANEGFADGFVKRYNREQQQGLSPEEAMRRTKVAYLDHPRYSHPFYWSSLVVLGDGTRARVGKTAAESAGLTLLAAALTLGALAIVFRRRSRAVMEEM